MNSKLKMIVGVLVLMSIISIFIFGKMRRNSQIDKISKDKGEAVAYIYAKVKPYKGSKVLKYFFYVENVKYKGTRSSHADYVTNVGDKFIVEYEKSNPKNNWLLLDKKMYESYK